VTPSSSPREEAARRYTIWVCPVCGQKYNYQPGLHRTAGDDLATSCFHGDRVQPKLVKLKVVPDREYLDIYLDMQKAVRNLREEVNKLRRVLGIRDQLPKEQEAELQWKEAEEGPGPFHHRRGE
jgi:hypothetical protein